MALFSRFSLKKNRNSGGFRFSPGETILQLFQGGVMGIAQIIPGVSGGTLALVMGIYERFIRNLNAVFGLFLAVLRYAKTRQPYMKDKIREAFRTVEWMFLIILFVGMLLAILAASGIIVYFLTWYKAQTYGLFVGLILASVVVPWSKMERKKFPEFLAIAIGFVLLFFLSGVDVSVPESIEAEKYRSKIRPVLQSPEKKAIFEKAYSLKQVGAQTDAQADTQAEAGQESSGSGAVYVLKDDINAETRQKLSRIIQQSGYNPSPGLILLFIGGAISVSAMLLPGLSGSFVLLVLGQYGFIVGLVNLLKQGEFAFSTVLLPLAVFGLGLVIGLVAFARVIDFLLKRFHSITMGFLVGLMIGSLRKINPFVVIPETGVNYQWTMDFLSTVILIVVGAALVSWVHRMSKKSPAELS